MPGGDLHLQPVGLVEAEAVDQEGVRLVEGGRGEHGVAEADPVGEEPARHQRRREGRGRRREPATSSTATPHGAVVRTSRATRRAARSSSVPSVRSKPAAARRCGHRVERGLVDGLERRGTTASFAGRPAATMTRWARSSLRHVSAPVAGRLAGDEADHVAEERGQGRGVGDLDAEVGELDLVRRMARHSGGRGGSGLASARRVAPRAPWTSRAFRAVDLGRR